MLRHILRAFHVKKLKYRVGAQGYFIDSESLTATNARWQVLQNDLANQSDPCIDFLYRVLVADHEDRGLTTEPVGIEGDLDRGLPDVYSPPEPKDRDRRGPKQISA
jgi:hypothetical protein